MLKSFSRGAFLMEIEPFLPIVLLLSYSFIYVFILSPAVFALLFFLYEFSNYTLGSSCFLGLPVLS